MKKIGFILLLALVFMNSCTKKEKIYTIGFCEFNDSPTNKETEEGFIKAFQDAKIVRDKNVKFEILNAQGDFPTVNSIIKKFVGDKVDIIFCITTPSLQNALNSTSTIPIVFSTVANPTLAGVSDKNKNVTGITTASPFEQTISIITEILPDVQHLGTIWTPSESNSEYYKERQEEEATKVGLKVTAIPVNSSNEMSDAVMVLINKNIDVIYQISDNLTNLAFEPVVKGANKYNIPLFCNQSTEVKRGAAIGLGWDFFDGGYEAGKAAIEIMQGKKPGDIPIRNLSIAKLTINLTAAKLQGLEIPQTILDKADEIIQ